MAGWLLDGIVAWLLTFTVDTLNELWALLAEVAFTTPDVTAAPQVAAVTARSLAVVDTCFVLVVITAGILVMTRETLQVRYGVADLGPRLVVAFIAANFSTPICQQAIEVANALTQAITGEPIASAATFAHLLRVVSDALANPSNVLLLVVIGLLIGVLTAMLLVAWLVRLVVLVVLVGIAPAAVACHALPQLDGAARLWWRALLGCLGTVVLQALALHTTVSVFLDPRANLGLPQDRSGMFNLFIVACLLWVTVRIPGLVRRYVTHSGGRNVGGYLLRAVVIHQLTRGVGLRLRRGSRAGPASAAGRGRGPGRPPPPGQPAEPRWRPRPPRPGQLPAARPASTRPAAARPPAAPVRPGARDAGPGPEARVRLPRPGVRPPGAIPPMRPTWQARGVPPPGTGWPDPPARPARTPGAHRTGTGWPSPAHTDSRHHWPTPRRAGRRGQ